MFRINKAFENDSTEIFRIEGQITDETLSEWTREISMITAQNKRQIILDFAQVWFIASKGVEVLMNVLSERVFILNCSMEIRNVFHVSGLSERILE